MVLSLRPFAAADYAAARSLWERTEGVGLSQADEESAIHTFIARNPGFSFVAVENESVIGTILVGHDGRRGYIHHLVVAASHRRNRLGRRLMDKGMTALARAGIQKCHVFVFETNASGQVFWEAVGAERRSDLMLYSLHVRGVD